MRAVAILALLSPLAAYGQLYSVEEIPTPCGYHWSQAQGISDDGLVVGNAQNFDGGIGFTWTRASGTRALREPGTFALFSADINSSGQFTGRGFFQAYDGSRSYTWNGSGQPTVLEPPAGVGNHGTYGISDAGEVVGGGFVESGTESNARAIIWRDGQNAEFLPNIPGKRHAYAYDVNNGGYVVGRAYTTNYSDEPAVRWNPDGTYTEIGNLPNNGYISDMQINNSGIVVGSGQRAFMFSPTLGLMDLFPDIERSTAEWISESGTIVGSLYGEQGSAYVWDELRGARILNDLLVSPSEGWDLRVAKSINAHGVIVGGAIREGRNVAFIATPVPEPSALLAIGFGMGMIFFRRARRRSKDM